MKYNQYGFFISSLLLLFFVLSVPCIVQSQIPADIYGILVRQSDGTELKVNMSSLKLTTQMIKIKENAVITDTLSKYGFFPDGESFNLLLTLNGNLHTLLIRKDIYLEIPVVNYTGNSSIKNAIENGYLLAITTDVRLKKDIIEICKSHKQLWSDPASILNNYKNDSARKLVARAANITLSLLEALRILINARTRPLNTAVLNQVRDEALLLDSIIGAKTDLTSAGMEQIKSISDNMQIRAGLMDEVKGPGQLPEPYPEQDIIVKVFNHHGEEIKGLRIYYVPPALYGNSQKNRQLPQLSSPTLGRLAVANYKIWAGKPGNPTPLSDIFPLELRRQKGDIPVTLELSIK